MAKRRSNSVRAATVFTAVAAVAGVALATAPPASADLTAELQDLALPAVTYSHQERTVSGRVVLTATDTAVSGESEGWQVTTQASGLRYSGLHNGTDISAIRLAIASVEPPAASDGLSETVDPVGGPRIPATSPVGSLDVPRIVLEAQPGHGRGTYTQGMVLSLTLPPGTRTGTYTGTITTTISPGLDTTAHAASQPSASPEPEPTVSPSPEATPEPTVSPEPTASPEPEATVEAASAPTASPEPEPTVSTGPEPTPDPDPEPTASTAPTP